MLSVHKEREKVDGVEKKPVDKNGEKRRNIVGKPVKTFCARVKTGWVNIKVGSVIKFITA